MKTKIIFLMIILLAGWGLGDIYHRIYNKYKSYPDVRTTVSFDFFYRPDGSGYMQYGDSDMTACEILLSNNKNNPSSHDNN